MGLAGGGKRGGKGEEEGGREGMRGGRRRGEGGEGWEPSTARD